MIITIKIETIIYLHSGCTIRKIKFPKHFWESVFFVYNFSSDFFFLYNPRPALITKNGRWRGLGLKTYTLTYKTNVKKTLVFFFIPVFLLYFFLLSNSRRRRVECESDSTIYCAHTRWKFPDDATVRIAATIIRSDELGSHHCDGGKYRNDKTTKYNQTGVFTGGDALENNK